MWIVNNDISTDHETIFVESNLDSIINTNFKYLNVLHINIRSVEKNFEELLILLHNLQREVHVLVLTETWLTDIFPDYLNIKNFNSIHVCNKYNKCDGIIIYVSNLLEIEQFSLQPLNHCNSIRISVRFNNDTYNITGIYRPWQCNVELFINELSNFFSNHKKETEIIIGDMNIDLLAKNESYNLNFYKTILSELGFLSVINKFTRVECKSSSCLDHIWIKHTQKQIKSYIIKSKITDHYPVGIVVLNKEKKEIPDTLLRKKFCLQQAVEEIGNIDWEDMYLISDTNTAAQYFINKICTCVNNASKEVKLNRKFTKLSPWITKGIIISIKNRNKLHKKMVCDPNNVLLKLKYKQYRNKLTGLIKMAKNKYFNSKIRSAGQDSRKIWNAINESLGKVKIPDKIKEIKTRNGILTEQSDIINSLNDYFVTIGETLATEQLKSCNCGREKNIAILPSIQETIVFWPVENLEILQYINSLKNDTSPGIDSVPAQLIKACKDTILVPLKYIINLSLESGVFPNVFKKALISPIHKAGPMSDMSNWRPITLISNFAKILEKCIRRQLLEFFGKHKILSEQQYGFRHGRSTSDAIAKLTEKITMDMDKNYKNITVFLDLKKAFDTVNHEKLLFKMQRYGVRGPALNLIKSYLEGRVQQTRMNNTISKTSTPLYGTPQGTSLSPCLFLSYVNDIHNIQQFPGEIIQFADDTCLIFTGSTWTDVYRIAEEGLQKINKWLHNNLLYLNTVKTKFITFSPTKMGQPEKSQLTLHSCSCIATDCREITCKKIERVDSIRYLGLTIDKHMTWKQHIYELCKKLRKLSYHFKLLKGFCDRKLLRLLYFALVQSVIEYGISAWGAAYPSILRNVEVTQKSIIKVILEKPRDYPTNEIFKDFQVLPIKKLFHMSVFLEYNKRPKSLFDHNYRTRNNVSKHLRYVRCKTKLYKSQGKVIYPKLYNNLPSDIRDIKNPKKLRTALQHWMIVDSYSQK